MFYFGLLDVFGLVKIKAFGEDAEKFYPLVKYLDFVSVEHARVVLAKNPNNIFPC